MSNIKLTDEDIKKIKQMSKSGASIRDLALVYKVHPSTITRCIKFEHKHSNNRMDSITKAKIKELLDKYNINNEDFFEELNKNFYIEYLEDINSKYFPIIELEG